MRVKQVTFDDDAMPESLVVEMSTDEAALIYAFVGYVSPKAVSAAAGGGAWGLTLDEVASCLSGSFFNVFWDDGAREVAPRIQPSVGVVS